ncbi:MAG TPA: response regulator [Candidatus Tectomicrobia bacterium]|nr:response regulator [Candidatus Tectomicrobia bacterium]
MDARPLRVLLVEDDADAREILGLALARSGYTVDQAADGSHALTLAAASAPDAAVVDLGLPDMDGFEVARRLRTLHDHTMLIALTGFSRFEDQIRAGQAGFQMYLVKPFDPDRLARLIRAARPA